MTPTSSTTSLSAVFWTRIHRYRSLLRRRWWVLLLTVSLTLCIQAWRVSTQPPTYLSVGKVIMDGKLNVGDKSAGYDHFVPGEFQKTIVNMIGSQAVRDRAWEIIEARAGGPVAAAPVEMNVDPAGTMFTVSATGPDPAYTQKYLAATMEAFLLKRREMKDAALSEGMNGVRSEIQRLERELKDDDEAILTFQKKHITTVSEKEEGNTAAKELANLRGKLSQLKTAADNLELQDPDQPASVRPLELNAAAVATGGNGSNGASLTNSTRLGLEDSADGDVRQVQQMLVQRQSEYDDLGRDLKPRHPKMMALKAEIEKQQKLLDNLRKQNTMKNKDRLALVRSLIERTQQEVDKAQQETLAFDDVKAELDKLREKRDRDNGHYSEEQKSIAALRDGTDIGSDMMTVYENASAPVSVKPSWIKALGIGLVAGLAAGIAVLVLLDRIDDRMGSFSDFQTFFSEPVIGQIPKDAEGGAELLKMDDARHQLVESYRNIRSSLMYMPLEGERPKTLLISSAVPNEGKSTIATNLALVMAFAGMKTLLIDGDLRRGAIHDAFGLKRERGLTDVLTGSLPWREAIRQTGVENLDLMPRGRTIPQPSEYLLNFTTDDLIKDLYPHYDYIVIDSSPVLAADDTASLAPKIDAVLFVVRMSMTSAKLVRKSLEILDKRQANIPGMILNFVDTTSPEFVYYQYPEYYHSPVEEPEAHAATGKRG